MNKQILLITGALCLTASLTTQADTAPKSFQKNALVTGVRGYSEGLTAEYQRYLAPAFSVGIKAGMTNLFRETKPQVYLGVSSHFNVGKYFFANAAVNLVPIYKKLRAKNVPQTQHLDDDAGLSEIKEAIDKAMDAEMARFIKFRPQFYLGLQATIRTGRGKMELRTGFDVIGAYFKFAKKEGSFAGLFNTTAAYRF